MTAASTQRRLTRILSVVPWVQAHTDPTVSEVMERFGYRTKRQLSADLALLFMCGVPGYGPGDLIVAMIDNDRVVIEMADYFARTIRLTPSEALGLLSPAMAVTGTSQALPALQSAVDKLVSAVFPDAPGTIDAELPPEPEHLEALRKAAAECRVVQITYLSAAANRTTTREVEPLMVHASMGRWYLSARCRLAEAHRTFRVDRIRWLHERPDHFRSHPEAGYPEIGFTPSADAIYATLALDPEARWVAEYYPVELIQDTGDEMLVRFATSDPRVAARLLIRLGNPARLVEGDEVADELRRLRQAILARYGEE